MHYRAYSNFQKSCIHIDAKKKLFYKNNNVLKNEWLRCQITNIKCMLKHGANLALRTSENSLTK